MEQSNSQRARAAFSNQAERERVEREEERQRVQARRDAMRYSWDELVRMGFWLSVGALVVFPVVMFVIGVVVILAFGAL